MALSTPSVPPYTASQTTGAMSAVSPEETNFLRFVNLVLKRAPRAVRVYFDTVHPPSSLGADLASERTTLSNLKARKVINQVQWDTLFGVNPPLSKNFDVTILICLLRNISPSTPAPLSGFDTLPIPTDVSVGADLARIKFYRNKVAHSSDARMNIIEFTACWTEVEGAIGRLGGSALLNETIALRVAPIDDTERELLLEFLVETKQLRLERLETVPGNVREIFEEKVESWEEEDQVFIETKASRAVEKFIKEHPCVVVVGHPGSGKSAIIHHIALKMGKEGFSIIPISRPDKIIDYHNNKNPQVFVVDDPCGEYAVNEQANEWAKYSEDIKKCLNFKKSEDQVQSKLLVSCRLVLSSARAFHKIKIFCNSLFSLENQDNQLSIIEKKEILEAHIKCELHFPRQIFEKRIDCFPLLCKLYVNVWADPNLLVSFFDNPFIHLVSKLDLMIDDPNPESIYEYCALVCCSLAEHKLALYLSGKDQTEDSECLHEIHNACLIELNRPELLSAINRQIGKYVKQIGPTFSVIHSKLLDIIVWHFAKLSPETLIQFSSSEIFQNRLRPFGRLQNDDKQDLFLVELDENMLIPYIKRIQKDIEQGKVTEVFKTPSMPNARIETRLFSLLLDTHDLNETLMKRSQNLSSGRIEGFTSFSRETLLKSSRVSVLHLLIAYNWSTFLKCLFQIENEILFQILFEQKACSVYLAILSENVEIVQWCFQHYSEIYENARGLIEQGFPNDGCCLFCNFIVVNESHEDHCPIARIPLILLVCMTGRLEILEFLTQNNIISREDLTSEFELMDEQVSPLMVSSLYGNYDIAHYLLLNEASVNFQNEVGISALHEACRNNHLNVINLLHDFGAVVDIKDGIGETPFSLACRNDVTETADLLLSYGANINLQDNLGWTALHKSIFSEHDRIVVSLINKGCDINIASNDGETPLSIACFLGNCDIIKLLLEKGVSMPHQQNGLLNACEKGNKNTVSLLLEQGLDINYRNEKGLTALHITCAQNKSDLLYYLLSKGACPKMLTENKRTSLHIASENLSEECISILANHGAELNALDDEGKTALHYACLNPITERFFTSNTRENSCCFHERQEDLANVQQTPTENMISKNTANTPRSNELSQYEKVLIAKLERIVDTLIQSNIDVNVADKNGLTPLHVACSENCLRVIEILIRNKANINSLDKDGQTPLHTACFRGHLKVLTLLIQFGANVNIADKTGSTALHIAAQKSHLDILSCLITNGANVNVQDRKGLTPLHVSCYNNDINNVQTLLDFDADTGINSKGGLNALTVAAANGYYHISDELLKKGAHLHNMNFRYLVQSIECKLNISKFLNKYSNVLAYRNNYGQSLLHMAALEKRPQWVEVLLCQNDLIVDRDKDGHTAFFCAIENGSEDVIKMFSKVDLSGASGIAELRMAHMKGRADIVLNLIQKYPPLLSNLNRNDYKIIRKFLKMPCVYDKIIQKALKNRNYFEIYNIILADLPDELWNMHTSSIPFLCQESGETSDRNWLEEKETIDKFPQRIMTSSEILQLEMWPLLFSGVSTFNDLMTNFPDEMSTLKDVIGNTSLHYICLTQNDSLVIDFLSLSNFQVWKTLVNVQNLAGCTPLHYAIQSPTKVFRLLHLGAKIGIKDIFGHDVLHYAITHKYDETKAALEFFLSDKNFTPLSNALVL